MKKRKYSDQTKRKVFLLRSQGLTYQEISTRLQMPIPTVALWLRSVPNKTRGVYITEDQVTRAVEAFRNALTV